MIRLILLLLCFPFFAEAQAYKFFVQFTDKSQTPFSISSPQQFLSQRAIDRRTRQNISISPQDLPVDPVYLTGVTSLGATLFTKSKWFNGVTVECDSNILSQIQQLPFVQNVEKVFRRVNFTNDKFERSGAPLAPVNQLNVFTNYGDAYNQIHLMNGEYLHEIGSRGEGMLIAVLDAGFDNVDQLDIFDSLRTENRIVAVKDFVDNDTNVYSHATHGTNVLSCITGNIPGLMVGTAPKASFLLLRSEDGPTENIIEEFNWNAAAEFADSAGADIISSSLGYTTFDDPTYDHSYSDMDGDHCPASIAADIAASKGMLVINSAGNSGSSSWHFIGSPADGDSVLAVGAVDADGHFASFSSYGPASDGAVKPNVASKGEASTVADAQGGVSNANGTSFSCPILAGSAACFWQTFPNKTAWEIKSMIERSANYFTAPNDSLGYGIPDFRLAYNLFKYGSLPNEDILVSIYPAPFDDHFLMKFFSATDQTLEIYIYNSIGQSVYNQSLSAAGGYYNDFVFNIGEGLGDGIYIVRIIGENDEFVMRTMKVD